MNIFNCKSLAYPTLKPESFKSKDINIHYAWLDFVDPYQTWSMRNSPNVLKYLSSPSFSFESHKSFLDNYSISPRIDFVLVESDHCHPFGCVSLCQTDLGLELGKYISDTRYLGQGIAKKATFNFLTFLSYYLPGQKILSRTNKDNIINIELNKKLGFHIADELDESFILMELSL